MRRSETLKSQSCNRPSTALRGCGCAARVNARAPERADRLRGEYSGVLLLSAASALSTERLRQTAETVRLSIANHLDQARISDPKALKAWMVGAEEREPGISWEYVRAELRRVLDGEGDHGELRKLYWFTSVALGLLDLADLSSSSEASAVAIDDVARLMLTSEDDDDVIAGQLLEIVTNSASSASLPLSKPRGT